MNWFTSDTHFGHRAVIEYCKRPFRDVAHMNTALIDNWNACVKPTDTIYHLGDVSFLGVIQTKVILSKLNGYKILVRGNHDRRIGKMLDMGFNEVYESTITRIAGHYVKLSHYPFVVDMVDERYPERAPVDDGGMKLLCGHVHKCWKFAKNTINVGVDQWDYAPVSEKTLGELLYTPVHLA